MEVTYKKLGKNLFLKYPNKVFVETGTYLGDSVQMAYEAGFKSIYSIELSFKYYCKAVVRFRPYDNVFIFKGDSSKRLFAMIADIDEPITFWLDGHYSKGDTALGEYCSPLMLELEQIKKHHLNTHTIMIDDMRCWSKKGDPVCKCDKFPCGKIYGFYSDDIIAKLKEINPDYKFTYENHDEPNDILVAYV